ncbi:hypothetical protein ADUPG1_013827 [Aduncisulcus paluster]|uniref:Uncharacterized protein n=1 Tax=Aduncisulcus paluster TaxID=2918883 RepID=A0ABQ5K6D6_9EUKA|nr:hypothetical protein ADUPG1_013827 [Aduncisulcus paluster]
MSSSTDAVIQTVKPELVLEGDNDCCPIPRDTPNIKSAEFPTIEAIDGTKEEDDEKYDQSFEAQKMMKGEGNSGYFTNISIPFSSSSPMKGAYICLINSLFFSSPPSHLIFTLTSSKGVKTSKKYKFPEFEDYRWYFLPVDLPDVVLCEIKGKGRKKESFKIYSLVFISREETPEEIKACEAREKLWSEAPVVKPEFVQEGGRDSIPIPPDGPKLVDPSFSKVKGKNDSVSKESKKYDQSLRAQRMLKWEDNVWLSHISIPFPSPSPMKVAYICVDKDDSSPSLLFTFTDCDGKKTCKKYEFIRPEHVFEWHFLPIDLANVVLCEIEGKGMWNEKNSRCFNILSLVFFREETPEERCIRESIEEQWSKAPAIKSEFVNSGDPSAIPIPRGNAAVNNPSFEMVKGKNYWYCKESEEYDQSEEAQKMLKGEGSVELSHLSIPFPSPSPMKGAYICVDEYDSSPSLLFTFTDCDGKKTCKKYEFTRPKHWYEWHFLPIDLDKVVLCEIEGKGRWEEENIRCFRIRSLVFFREETPEERCIRESIEEQWSKAPTIKSEFVNSGDASAIPIPRDNAAVKNPSFEMVKGKNDLYRKESEKYDRSEEAQEMLKGEGGVWLSHLSIPFPSPSPMKGAYICVDEDSSPSLLFTFTDCDGKKTYKKYEFTRSKHWYEWHFLPIDLDNVVLCEIEGKGTWYEKKSRCFCINSLVFTVPKETVVSELLSLLPWEHSKDDIVTKLEKTCYYFGQDLTSRGTISYGKSYGKRRTSSEE